MQQRFMPVYHKLVHAWRSAHDSMARTRRSFPPLASALKHPNGLLAAGADLSPARLLAAYRRGIFPWYSDGEPILWWSPDPRMVLIPSELKIARSLAKTLRNRRHEIRFDSAFEAVLHGCATGAPDPAAAGGDRPGTWITDEIAPPICACTNSAMHTRRKRGWKVNSRAACTAWP